MRFRSTNYIRMFRIGVIVLPLMFTAQACNLFDFTGEQGSGSRGIFLSTDSGQTWEEAGKISKDKTLSGAAVSRLVIEPGKPNNILAATLNMGVFGSDNNGKNWVSLLPGFAAYDAFFNPRDSQEIFVAGSRNKLAVILKSPDRGGTWIQIYNEPTGQAAVTSLIFDARNPSVFYAGLSSGTVLRSIDGGNTWNTLSAVQDRIVDLALGSDGNTLYLLGRSQGLRRSADAGRTWTELNFPDKPAQYNDLFRDPANWSLLYVGTDKGLYTSLSGGAEWNKVPLPVTAEVNQISAVTTNPQSPSQIFAAIRSTIYRSDDRGATWSIQSLPTLRTISDIAIDPEEPNRIYVGLK